MVIDASGYGESGEVFARAWCADRGVKAAIVARGGRGCIGCAVREAGGLGVPVVIWMGEEKLDNLWISMACRRKYRREPTTVLVINLDFRTGKKELDDIQVPKPCSEHQGSPAIADSMIHINSRARKEELCNILVSMPCCENQCCPSIFVLMIHVDFRMGQDEFNNFLLSLFIYNKSNHKNQYMTWKIVHKSYNINVK